MRMGIGYDVHRLAEGRRLVLGGVEIEFEKGLLGHSDADVLIHAVIDALLGAAGLGDIGGMFPDTDSRYKGISSLELLKQVGDVYKAKRLEIVNIDCIIVAQKPMLSPYFPLMRGNAAAALGIGADRINIKAKTEEGLGFTGSGEGMAAHAICCADGFN